MIITVYDILLGRELWGCFGKMWCSQLVQVQEMELLKTINKFQM